MLFILPVDKEVQCIVIGYVESNNDINSRNKIAARRDSSWKVTQVFLLQSFAKTAPSSHDWYFGLVTWILSENVLFNF